MHNFYYRSWPKQLLTSDAEEDGVVKTLTNKLNQITKERNTLTTRVTILDDESLPFSRWVFVFSDTRDCFPVPSLFGKPLDGFSRYWISSRQLGHRILPWGVGRCHFGTVGKGQFMHTFIWLRLLTLQRSLGPYPNDGPFPRLPPLWVRPGLPFGPSHTGTLDRDGVGFGDGDSGTSGPRSNDGHSCPSVWQG